MAKRMDPDVTPERRPDPNHAGDRDGDLALVRSILTGSPEAWRAFLLRYSALIHAVIHRYLHARNADEARTLYVEVLESLYRRKLATYEGRAALSTWLTVVVRTGVLDHLRHRFGRRELPRALRGLREPEREIFRLYYVQGRSFVEVMGRLNGRGGSWSAARLVAALQRIEDQLDPRWLRRLAYDLHAQSTGAASGRLLEYLDHVRHEFEHHPGAHSPEYHLMEREACDAVSRIRSLIGRLPAEDQRILTLRFERGWSARRIAEELGLPGPRGVYTVLDRILRGLRRQLPEGDEP